jgi:hypothetical protein
MSVATFAANTLFRYPVLSTLDLPRGRIASYVSFGVDAQRAVLSLQIVPYREVDCAPARQVLVGMKFFVMNNLAVFGGHKRIWSTYDFTYSGSGIKHPGYEEKWSLATNVLVGGVSLHFQEVTGNRIRPGTYLTGEPFLPVLRVSCSRYREW